MRLYDYQVRELFMHLPKYKAKTVFGKRRVIEDCQPLLTGFISTFTIKELRILLLGWKGTSRWDKATFVKVAAILYPATLSCGRKMEQFTITELAARIKDGKVLHDPAACGVWMRITNTGDDMALGAAYIKLNAGGTLEVIEFSGRAWDGYRDSANYLKTKYNCTMQDIAAWASEPGAYPPLTTGSTWSELYAMMALCVQDGTQWESTNAEKLLGFATSRIKDVGDRQLILV